MPAVAWNLVAVLSFTGKSRRWIELKKDWLNTGVGKLPKVSQSVRLLEDCIQIDRLTYQNSSHLMDAQIPLNSQVYYPI